MSSTTKTDGARPWPDFALATIGVLFGWASLTYPLGRDQGLYYYVAREWIYRGAIPYRDVLDHKTPGIYVLHALSMLVFGEHFWSIRVCDLVGVALLGLIAATFTVERGERVRIGVRGGSICIISLLFYGFLNFWDTAQSELWYALLGLASIWAIRRVERTKLAEIISGAFASASMIMKPPAVWFVMIAFGLAVLQVWPSREGRTRRVITTTLRFGGGFAVPLALLLGYFGAHHALGPMKDIVVGANSYYVSHETSIHSLGDVVAQVVAYYRAYNPVDTVMLAGLVAGLVVHRRRNERAARDRYALAVVLCIGGFFAVAMQKKFYFLHWTVVLGPATVVGALLLDDALAFFRARRSPRWQRLGALGIVTIVYVASVWGPLTWWHANRNAFAYLSGSIDHNAYSDTFTVPSLDFWYGHSERTGLWLRDHSTPHDTIAVRGFDPEIYAVAERHYAGRFFWTTFLTSPVRAYRREEWLAEDRAAFDASRPRYVVALSHIHEGIDAAETYEARGYVKREVFDEFTVLERP